MRLSNALAVDPAAAVLALLPLITRARSPLRSASTRRARPACE